MKAKKLNRRNWDNEARCRIRPTELPLDAVLDKEFIDRMEPMKIGKHKLRFLRGFLDGGINRRRQKVAAAVWREVWI